MLPRLGASKLITRWIVMTLAASFVAMLDGGWLASWGALAPAQIWRGEVWRLVTWPFIEPGPVSLVITCIVIYKFGGELAVRWGDRRLRRYVATVVLLAAAVTCVLATVTGRSYIRWLGGWAVADVLVIAWARQFPDATLVLYGVLPVRGRDLVRITVAISIVYAVYIGFVAMAPELVACAAAATFTHARLRR